MCPCLGTIFSMFKASAFSGHIWARRERILQKCQLQNKAEGAVRRRRHCRIQQSLRAERIFRSEASRRHYDLHTSSRSFHIERMRSGSWLNVSDRDSARLGGADYADHVSPPLLRGPRGLSDWGFQDAMAELWDRTTVSACRDDNAGTFQRRNTDATASQRAGALNSSVDVRGVRPAFEGALVARIEIS